MSNRLLGWLALLCLIFTVLWLVLLVARLVSSGPMTTFELALAHTAHQDALFTLTYLNAALVTLSAAALLAGLVAAFRQSIPGWAEIAFVFVAVYATINLLVYLSQVTVVPNLLSLRAEPTLRNLAEFLLRQAIQEWPSSAVAHFNSLAYAVLGIPSLILAAPLLRMGGSLRLSGLLLALNGVACILGFGGAMAQSAWLSMGTLIGGALFLLALAFMAFGFLQREKPVVEQMEVR